MPKFPKFASVDSGVIAINPDHVANLKEVAQGIFAQREVLTCVHFVDGSETLLRVDFELVRQVLAGER